MLETLREWTPLEDDQTKGPILQERLLTAGLGIEFSTRRRNKFAGKIDMVKARSDLDYDFRVDITEALGYVYVHIREYTNQGESGLSEITVIVRSISMYVNSVHTHGRNHTLYTNHCIWHRRRTYLTK